MQIRKLVFAVAYRKHSFMLLIIRLFPQADLFPVSILYKSITDRYRPVRVADGPITARCRFIRNASWVGLDVFDPKIGLY